VTERSALKADSGTTPAAGEEMHALIARLYPICRSITGEGVRETLRILGERIALDIHEVPSGTAAFDWEVPREWNIRDAYVKDSHGKRVIDFGESNLHVVGYSLPVHATMTLAELRPHLSSLPDRPDWVPYRTAYYDETWGFCVAHRRLLGLDEGEYEVRIDASLEAGSLTYGELFLEGETADEILIHAHCCHPSLCNDNLSGVVVATELAAELARRPRRHSFRFLFLPGTIGPITWLARNEERARRIKHGLVLAGVGDRGHSTYKRSRRGNDEIDRAVEHVLRHAGAPYEVEEFTPYGYDERQYSSPGFDLPVGCLMRTPHGRYPEYHTSADDLDFVDPDALSDSLAKCLRTVEVLEGNRIYLNTNPKGEPRLGKRGIYEGLRADEDRRDQELALLWVLNLSDGRHSLLDVAERAGIEFTGIRRAADLLLAHGLLVPNGDGSTRA
jgi:aminopeptidase-like protein